MKRRMLSKSDAKRFLRRLYSEALLPEGSWKNVEILEEEGKRVYVIDGELTYLVVKERIVPSVFTAEVLSIPKVVVDRGAIPHLINGADVMVPGIVRVEEFEQHGIVRVFGEGASAVLCVGYALMSSSQIKSAKRGKAIKNIHHINDKLYQWLLELGFRRLVKRE
ncbi:DUF1947 domain-containing protein [archaeon]|nr:DUF1947 domain-containing protein [archaeon]